MSIWIEMDLCNGCGRCIRACPYGAVELEDGKAVLLERCTACGACLEVCKEKAVLSDAKPREVPDFRDRKGVWVFAEQRNGTLSRVSLELLGRAQELASLLEQDVSTVLVGHQVSDISAVLMEYGAETVYLADHMDLKDYRTNAYTTVIADLITQHSPNIFLVGAVDIAGLAVAFPVGIGLALVIGVIENYVAVPAGNPFILFGGVGLIVIAIIVDAIAYGRLSSKGEQSHVTKGIVLSILAGIGIGVFYRFLEFSMARDFIV